MEDKDFLGYFSKLGPPSSLEEIKKIKGITEKVAEKLYQHFNLKG